MNNITKVSDITYLDVADYLRVSDTQGEQNTLEALLKVSKTFISKYTGQPMNKLDEFQDFVIVVFILCQDMYDNRTLYVDSNNFNKVVETILGMHSINLLPKEDALL